MSETAETRGLLSRHVETGQLGNAEHGVIISERRTAMLQVTALGPGRGALEQRLQKLLDKPAPNKGLHAAIANGLIVAATGPKEYWCFAEDRDPEEFREQIEATIGDAGAVFQQSDSRAVLTLQGRAAETVLAKGCAVDFHASAFPVPGACHAMIELMPILIVKRDDAPTFDLAVTNSYADSFLDWLVSAVQDVGYRIDQS